VRELSSAGRLAAWGSAALSGMVSPDDAADEDAPALVLVTHHVEEIPPGFTHVLLLRGGRVVAAGPIATTLTAGTLAETFGIALELARSGPRWSARAAT